MGGRWRSNTIWLAMGVEMLLATPAFAHPGEHGAHTPLQWLAAAVHTLTEADHLLVLVLLALPLTLVGVIWRRRRMKQAQASSAAELSLTRAPRR